MVWLWPPVRTAPLPPLGGGRPVSVTCAQPDHDPQRLIRDIAVDADRGAFAALFIQFAPRVNAYLMRLGLDAAQAEEQVQEVMLTVWHKAAQYDPARASAAAWIFTIVRNLRIDAARRARLATRVQEAEVEPSAEPLADAVLAAANSSRRVRAAVAALPADVVQLAFFDDRPRADIERALSIPLGTVKSRLRLAMARLGRLLDDAQ